jgi:hypothetical protein
MRVARRRVTIFGMSPSDAFEREAGEVAIVELANE